MGLGGIVSGAANAAKQAAEAAARAAAAAAKKAAEASQQAAQKTAESVKAGAGAVGKTATSVVKTQAKDVFEGAKDAVNKGQTAAKKAIDQTQKTADRVVDKTQKVAKKAVDKTQKAADRVVDKTQQVARKAVDKTQRVAQKTVDKTQQVANRAVDKAQQKANRAVDKVQDLAGGGGVLGAAVDKVQQKANGAVDKAQQKANGAVDKVQQKANGAVDKVQQKADRAVDKVQQKANGAVDKVQDLAGGAVDKVQDLAGGAAERLKSAVDTAGDFAEGAVDKAQDVTSTLGRAAQFAFENPGVVADKATDLLADGMQKAGEFVQDAPAIGPLGKVGNLITGGALQAGADLVRDPVKTANTVKDAVTLSSQVDSLKPGESAKVSLEGSVNGALLAGKGKGEIEVKRNAADEGGGYTVSINGEAGAGVAAKLGAKGAADAGASAYGVAGTKVEFKFDTAEEAKQATDALTRAGLAAGAGTVGPPGLGTPIANQLLGNPLEDVAALKDNVSAVEFKVGTEGSLNGSLGTKGMSDVLGVGAKGSLDAKMDTTARVEFDKGHPSKLVVKQSGQWSAQAAGSAGLNVPGSNGGSTSLPGGASVEGKEGVSVELSQSFNLPKDFDPKSLVTDPVGTGKQIAATAQDSQEVKVSITDARQGSIKGLGFNGSMGEEVKVELTAKPEEIARSGAVDSLLQGDIGKAMTQADRGIDVKATLQEKTTEGNNAGVGINAGAGGGEVGLSTERTHLGDKRELSPEQLAQHYLTRNWAAGLFS